MDVSKRQARSKRVDEKRKFGTTVLVKTEDNIGMFKSQYPQEFKTPGEVVDLMASLCLRVNPSAAAELYEFCEQRAEAAQRELYELKGSALAPLQAAELNTKIEYYKALGVHMSRFVPQELRVGKRLPMKRVDMRVGAYLIIPDDWNVINEGDARSCDYAFVLEARNWEKYDIPHFVYLSAKETCPNSEVIEAASAVWPRMKNVLGMQVEPAYDKDGGMLNAEEWDDAPTVGVFPIRDASSFSVGNEAPFGAMVYRH